MIKALTDFIVRFSVRNSPEPEFLLKCIFESTNGRHVFICYIDIRHKTAINELAHILTNVMLYDVYKWKFTCTT